MEILENRGVVIAQSKRTLGLDKEIIVRRRMGDVVDGCCNHHDQQIHLLEVAFEGSLRQVRPDLVRHQSHLSSMGTVVVRIRLDVAVVHSFYILLNLQLLRLDKVSNAVLLPDREEDLKHRLVAGPLELKNIHTIPNVDVELADSIFEVHASRHHQLRPQIICGTAVLQMLSPKQENPPCADVFLYLPHDISEAPKAAVGL
mmetsp:Transcript_48854/g.114825  ORF Transcript_48854/g.114825 Transcript_48854/m.114825 type:complete len:201 (-) Transcript_48854:631-1233(-)